MAGAVLHTDCPLVSDREAGGVARKNRYGSRGMQPSCAGS